MADTGWYPDPTGRHEQRFFDGARWTSHVADAGTQATDEIEAGPTVAPATAVGIQTSVPAQTHYAVRHDAVAGLVIPGGVVPAGSDLASPWARLGAYFLDVLLAIVTLIIGWIIWTLILWSKGQTPAKKLLGMRVVKKATGQTATWGGMFVRDFLMRGIVIPIVSVFTCGILNIVGVLMIFSAYHETLWDKWSGTLVVKERDR